MLAERYAPAGANKGLAALRGALKEAWRLGQVDAEAYRRAVDLAPVHGSGLPRGRALARAEIMALFRMCIEDGAAGGVRDGAMLAVLYGAGLRRSELVGLDLADYAEEAGTLVVHGKGDRSRLAYVDAGMSAYLADWLELRGEEEGPLFYPVLKNGRIVRRRLWPQSVRKALGKRAEAAGVAQFAPHDLRRTFIGDLLEAGVDMVTVQQLAGHASVQTTAGYDRRPDETRRRAAGLLHLPYLRQVAGRMRVVA